MCYTWRLINGNNFVTSAAVVGEGMRSTECHSTVIVAQRGSTTFAYSFKLNRRDVKLR